jgi:hypothetical protein
MIFVGLDDTDTLDTPGTNQLARHLVRELAPQLRARMILRHQLLEDPRVPCTRKNGCASIAFEEIEPVELTALAERLKHLILKWIPEGSDPGLAIATRLSPAIEDWGLRAKRELLTQREARALSAAEGIYLQGLAGTEDGVIGALAAFGLASTRDDGRVVYFSTDCPFATSEDVLDVTGPQTVAQILGRGIDAVVDVETNVAIESGVIEIGKKLRPNLRHGQIVLFATRRSDGSLEAVRVT